MDGFRLALLVLAAVLVGAAIPVLLELRRTLRAVRGLVETTGPRLDDTLTRVNGAADRLGRVGEDLHRATAQVRTVAEGLGSVAGLIGPALAGVVEALLRPRREATTP